MILKDFIKTFSTIDTALLVFLLIAGISTIRSDYVYESFWGNEGRFSGLVLLSLYGAAYFCVTRLAVICCLMMTGGLTGVTYCRINCVPCLFDFFCSESHSQSQQKPVCHSGFFCSALLLGAGICKLESANCYTDYEDASHARGAWYTSFFVELLDAP